MNYSEIPVIINNRNRLTSLVSLIEWLESVGQKNIIILDNASTYPPLLAFYEKSGNRFTVRMSDHNFGSKTLWWSDANKDLLVEPLIYTDSDIIPTEDCPKDTIEFLYHLAFERFLHVPKVGFGLKIDDLPDHYKPKPIVMCWEGQFWEKPLVGLVNGVQCYEAPVDTTFALYRDAAEVSWSAIRTGPPHVARHTDWYRNSLNPTEEEAYYEARAELTHSWSLLDCVFEPAVEKYERERNAE